MAAPKGHQKAGGRQKGTPNKLTSTFKDLVISTMEKLQEDDRANLETWAKENPTEFYKIASKLIPTEVSATVNDITQGMPRAEWLKDDPETPKI